MPGYTTGVLKLTQKSRHLRICRCVEISILQTLIGEWLKILNSGKNSLKYLSDELGFYKSAPILDQKQFARCSDKLRCL